VARAEHVDVGDLVEQKVVPLEKEGVVMTHLRQRNPCFANFFRCIGVCDVDRQGCAVSRAPNSA
jgi:hypothetical protein